MKTVVCKKCKGLGQILIIKGQWKGCYTSCGKCSGCGKITHCTRKEFREYLRQHGY